MTLLILVRHGNTFESGEQAVWVGARTDPPLTAKGREQAVRIGRALRRAGLFPRLTLAGPLQRTRETATLALGEAGVSLDQLEIDGALREIDYGPWEGKSSAEIQNAGGGMELAAWEQAGDWPSRAGWPLSREAYLKGLTDLFACVQKRRADPALIVSSNGLFRLLASSIGGDGAAAKMATGHMGILRLNSTAGGEFLGWNLPPEDFPAHMARLN